MQDLLPHYERELAFLRNQAEEFGRRYPRIAGRLAVTGEVLQDPHVERMIQAFALLGSRIHKRLDDDFPLFAESFLDLLYPHYLRPLPASSIVRFELPDETPLLNVAQVLPRGTAMQARPMRGVICRFRTTSELRLVPIRVASVAFRGSAAAPAGTWVPRQATATLSIELALTGPQAIWATLGIDRIRLYVDGDPSLVTLLRETLTHRVLATMVQAQRLGAWSVDAGALPKSVGLDDADALIDFDARSHTAYRLLTEYFAFPEKFNFVDLPLPEAACRATGNSLTLHLALGALSKDGDDARLLELVSAANLLIGCVPVTNLYETRAEPVKVDETATMHAVLPDSRRPSGHDVYAIDRVQRVHKTAEGETIESFKPFYSLQHDDLLRDGESASRYWFSHRNGSDRQSPASRPRSVWSISTSIPPCLRPTRCRSTSAPPIGTCRRR